MKENPILLHIETATEVCSVALSRGDTLLGVCEGRDGNSHSKNLLPYIDKVLKEAELAPHDLDAVAVSIGPGSYTGLRIGVSTAKSFAYTLEIPVLTVSTLESLAQGALQHLPAGTDDFQIVPMIDARRMEVFAARYDRQLQLLDEVAPVIVDEEAYRNLLADQIVVFCGNGMPKCKELLAQSSNARFADFELSARYLLPTALAKWQKQDFADVAYFEPFYLKEYVPAKPNVKGLHA